MQSLYQSVQLLSCIQLFGTPWTAACQASLSITNSRSSPKLMSSESVMPPNHLILCRPPFSSHPQSFPASGSFQMSQLFTSGGQSIGVSASTSVLPMNTQDYLLQDGVVGSPCRPRDSQESSLTPQFKASILWHSAFFTVQLSHPYTTTGKTIALTTRIFVGKVMSLLLDMLSRLVITFLPRSKHLLISWLQSPSAVTLEPKKIKSLTVSIVSPSIYHEVVGQDIMILVL